MKSFQLLEGFAPRHPDQRLCPWTVDPTGAQPPNLQLPPTFAIPPPNLGVWITAWSTLIKLPVFDFLFTGSRIPAKVKPCPHCGRKVRLLQKTATIAEFGDSRTFLRQAHFSASVALFCDSTVALFCDSVDRA